MKKIGLFLLIMNLFQPCLAKTGKEIIQENGFKPYVAPLLTTKWAQYGGGENAFLPNVNASDRESKLAKTGCGATALAQIMKYWNYPQRGRGHNSYHWQHPNTKELISRYVDFSESYYDWDNMIDKYFENNNRTQKQIDAVAKLMYDIGIALEMQYKDWSTATQIEYISTVLKKNFSYNPYLRIVRQIPGGYTMDEWLAIIYRELSEGRPILVGADNDSRNRHIFVADGYDEEGKVHFNLGHAKDSENKYYDLISPGRDGNDWLYNMRMIIGISPQEIPAETSQIHVSKPGTILSAMGGETEAKKICRMKVTGRIGKADIDVLKRLSRADIGQSDLSEIGQLSYLDLSEASMENDELPDSAFWYRDNSIDNLPCFTLQTIKLPSNLKRIGHHAFRSCLGLYEVIIPPTLESIGKMAFFGCRYLESIILPESIKQIGKSAFGRAKVDKLDIVKKNPYYYVENNTIFTADGKTIVAYTGKERCNYIILDGVEKIDDTYVFTLKANLMSVTIPASLKSFNYDYFDYCPGITDVFSYTTTTHIQSSLMYWIKHSKIVLHIPIGFKRQYEEAYKQFIKEDWNGVGSIVEDLDPSSLGMEEVSGMPNIKSQNVYDISGRKVPAFQRRNNQLYIINGRKIIMWK